MLLAIDVGNTNIVFAICEGDEIRWRWRISTDGQRTADEYAVWLHQLMALEGVERTHISAAIIATVVPPTLFNLQRLCRKYFNVEPMVVAMGSLDLGVKVAVPNPAEVGADRLVNTVAAHHAYPGNLIVIDFGTATTFDVVAAEGAYCGGVIAPGINLSMEALYQAAAKLPRIAVEPPADGLGVIGRGTVHAMQSGVFWGYVGLIEGLVQRIKAEMSEPVTVIATGGLATLFNRHTSTIDVVDGDLTISGLIRIHAINEKKNE
ncbi:type III pantothenate kinase [Polymorphobacter multimanifer]|uniref:Type III pantothenate kinase n=1 Tax=Polymorphobacter multimanifer TaxID=1070431 RepID=A0A841L148_9SPHN|nr:type III pantothenate kinase [Polymorphobacter multimanifer]MBB6226284.1 type III pantothenate kinase [Polymorphobacter multimanifer]GGI86608.1 type III pantothenate kinase [Polymorphobacter multimanifer]